MNEEERVYSVTMTEEELSLFSEFLGQREYAVKHYAPVSERSALAKKAWENRKHNNSIVTIAAKVRDLELSSYPVKMSTYEKVRKAGHSRILEQLSEDKRLLENKYKPNK